ncbi:hypothetical protein EJC49_08965 [Aquibium carbonis]|uniref:CsgH-like domain-containing protein n=1 Tax=Aquibium carbonis TaxID=2495581 RepID=A0A429YZC2_9HYPH|nr:curli-like amyloid fiber formation chaperone CsgH [Aquibium carbonis]RST86826.1 hypothetical protein EJC49_08965 [Aquibium carbonis]
MPHVSKRFVAAAAILVIGAGAAVATAGPSPDPNRCEIVAEKHGAAVTLIGLYYAAKALDGEYTFRVRGAGRSGTTDIAQGGEFSVDPSQPAEIGQVMLGGGGTSYDATLVVKAAGKTWRCSERIGGR